MRVFSAPNVPVNFWCFDSDDHELVQLCKYLSLSLCIYVCVRSTLVSHFWGQFIFSGGGGGVKDGLVCFLITEARFCDDFV